MGETTVTLQKIFAHAKIMHPWWFFFLVPSSTLIIRLILTFFKAHAIKNGEADNTSDSNEKKWRNEKLLTIFSASFWSNGKDIRIDDYWLPVLIGLSELAVYPCLMVHGYWTAIGAWIVIKTASQWGGWQKTRTAYNRFLLGNILSLGCSAFISFICFS